MRASLLKLVNKWGRNEFEAPYSSPESKKRDKNRCNGGKCKEALPGLIRHGWTGKVVAQLHHLAALVSQVTVDVAHSVHVQTEYESGLQLPVKNVKRSDVSPIAYPQGREG